MIYSNCNQMYLLLIILIKEVVNEVVYTQERFHGFIFRSTDFQIYKSYELNESSDLHVIESHPSSLRPHGLYSPWNSPGQNTGVGNLSLLKWIFPTQGSNPGLLHYRWILYQLSHKGSPSVLEWVAYPFSGGSSRPRNGTGANIGPNLYDYRVIHSSDVIISLKSILEATL